MSSEPAYLQRIREAQAKREGKGSPSAAAKDAAALSVQEKEALRWAREAAGTELRATKNLAGARYAVLLRVQSASGTTYTSVEGLASREALVERVKPGAGMGEEVLGAYEVKGGRPVTISTDEQSQIKLVMGAPRPGANPVAPEKMLRKAEADAIIREKTRPKDRDRGGRR